MPGSRRREDLFPADAMQASARGFMPMPIASYSKGYHTPEKVVTDEDLIPQFLLERIVRRDEAFFHVHSRHFGLAGRGS